jgi:uncharacterized protein (UPF0276 family)
VIENRPEMDWFEIISENFMVDGGAPRYHLDRLRETYPVIPHGVSMSLGGAFDPSHLARLRLLCDALRPAWVSDHVCWTGTAHVNTHDLLPVPYTPAMRDAMVDRIRRTADALGRPFAVENASSYLTFRSSIMPEWEFVADLVERADCGLLLDVNNVFVSSVNHGFDPWTYIEAIPADRVVQVHLAGHSVMDEGYRLDTHDHPVCDEVWALFRRAIERIGPVSVLVEWDGHIPTWERLAEEAATARTLKAEALTAREARHVA